MAKSAPEEEVSPELKELYQYVGQRVRNLREAKKMSQKDLAARSGMKQPYLAEIELLGVNLSLKLLHRLSSALGLLPRDLLPEAGEPEDYETVLRKVRDYVIETEPSVRSLAAHYSNLATLLDSDRRSEDP